MDFEEDEDVTLMLPDMFFQAAVHAALAEGLIEKDSTQQGYYERLFERKDTPAILSETQEVGGHRRLVGSPIAEASRITDFTSRYRPSYGDGSRGRGRY